MSDKRSSMMEPPIEELLDKVDSKFTLVTLSARRGREINSYFNQLGEGLGSIVPPQVVSESRKPLSIAMEEIAAGKIVTTEKKQPSEEEETAEQLAAQSAAQDMADVFGSKPEPVPNENLIIGETTPLLGNIEPEVESEVEALLSDEEKD